MAVFEPLFTIFRAITILVFTISGPLLLEGGPLVTILTISTFDHFDPSNFDQTIHPTSILSLTRGRGAAGHGAVAGWTGGLQSPQPAAAAGALDGGRRGAPLPRGA